MKSLLIVLVLGFALSLLIWAGLQIAVIPAPFYVSLGAGIMLAAATLATLKTVIRPELTPEQRNAERLDAEGLAATARVQQTLAAGEMPDPADIAESSREMLRKHPPKPRAPLQRQPAIALTRAPRGDAQADAAARSWFGGTPALGGTVWPKNGDGLPLHLMAQLDLPELQAQAPTDALPGTGALMFFCDVGWPMTGKVIYVPHPDYDRLPQVPQNAVPPFAGEDWRYYFPGTKDAHKPLGFPRWPITFTPVPLRADVDPYEDEEEIEAAFASALGLRPKYRFDSAFFNDHMTENGQPVLLWKAGQMLANELSHASTQVGAVRARITKSRNLLLENQSKEGGGLPDWAQKTLKEYDDRLQAIQDREPQFQTFVEEVYEFAAGHAPYARMSDKGRLWLDKVLEALTLYGTNRGLFADLIDEYGFAYKSREYLMRDWMRAMANGPQDGFAALPPAAQAEIAQQYNQPEGATHQMFGLGVNIQQAGEMNESHHLLLQLGYDTLMHWQLGDMGALQFWITEDDLRNRRWDNVISTLEAS